MPVCLIVWSFVRAKRVTIWPNGQQLLFGTYELPQSPPNSLKVEPLDFASCPRCTSQELETGSNARIELKTTDSNPSREFFPAQLVHQLSHYHLECDSVDWIVGLGIGHCLAIVTGVHGVCNRSLGAVCEMFTASVRGAGPLVILTNRCEAKWNAQSALRRPRF